MEKKKKQRVKVKAKAKPFVFGISSHHSAICNSDALWLYFIIIVCYWENRIWIRCKILGNCTGGNCTTTTHINFYYFYFLTFNFLIFLLSYFEHVWKGDLSEHVFRDNGHGGLHLQVLGYGWAGLLRKYVVEPAHMWWPATLVQVSLFRYVLSFILDCRFVIGFLFLFFYFFGLIKILYSKADKPFP